MEKGRGGVKKLPRNISGKELIKLLGKYGYREVGQSEGKPYQSGIRTDGQET